MGLSDNIACILDILMALFQPSLWMVIVTKRVRHSSVAFHSNIIARRFEQLAVLVRLVSTEIVFCGDNVRPWHTFERLREYGRCHPVLQRRLSEICKIVSVSISVEIEPKDACLCLWVSSGP